MRKHPTYVFREVDDRRHKLRIELSEDKKAADKPASQADLLRVLEWVTDLASWAIQADARLR